MIRSDEKILGAILSLDGNPNWEVIRQWFRDSLGEIFVEQGAYSPETTKYIFNAGRNKELKELIQTIDKAKENLERIRKSR
jgi:predicted HAD superfamily phosphohydrolase